MTDKKKKILNIFAKHSCNEEMEKLGLQISAVSQEGKSGTDLDL